MPSTTNTHTHTHFIKECATCGICGEVLRSTLDQEDETPLTRLGSRPMSLSEEVRAKELKNKQNLEAMKEKRDAAKKAKQTRYSKKAKEVREFESGGAAEKPSIAQAVLAAIAAAFAAVSSVSNMDTDAEAEEEAREFISRVGCPTNEFAIRGVVKAFNATVGAGGEMKVKLKQQRVQQYRTITCPEFPINGPPDGDRRPGSKKRVKNTPEEDRMIQTIEVYDFNLGKMVKKSGFVYETDFSLGLKVFPEFEDLYYAMIVTAFKCGMPPVMPFSGNEMFFSEQQAIDFAKERNAQMCGVSGIPYVGSWDKHCLRVGTPECLAALEAKKARFADAKKETEKSAAPKQTKQNGNKFAGLMVDSESDSEDEPSTPPVKVESKVSSPKAKHDARKAAQKAKKAAAKVVDPAPKKVVKAAAKVVAPAPKELSVKEKLAALKAEKAAILEQREAERKAREAEKAAKAKEAARIAAEKAAKEAEEAELAEYLALQKEVEELRKTPEQKAAEEEKATKRAIKKCEKALKSIEKLENKASLTPDEEAKVARKAEFKEELAKLTEEQWAAQFEAPTQEPEPVKVAAPAPAAPTTKWVTLSKGPNRLFEGFGC